MAAYGMLAKLAIVEAGGGIAGRYCGRLFSMLGASVVRIADDSDDTLVGGGGPSGIAFGCWLDEGKTRVNSLEDAIAHLASDGRAPQALITGRYREDRERALASARALSPQPLVLSALWFDENGPYANWRGSDAVMAALSGLPYSIGLPEGPPTISPTYMAQQLAGVNLFTGALAALRARERDIAVSLVETSIHEALLCFGEVLVPELAVSGRSSKRPGINLGATCQPTGIFRAHDGWVGLCALTQQQWEGFCELIERKDLLTDSRFDTFNGRLENTAALWSVIEPILLTRSADDLAIKGQKLRVPVTQVPDQQGLLESPHWTARRSLAPVESADSAPRAPVLPFRAQFDGVRTSEPSSPAQMPLSGVRVIDFSMGWAGPLATRVLADFGADVIKIESRSAPDWIRGGNAMSTDDPPGYEMNRMFAVLNRNKRDILLDLREPADLAKARVLVSTADMVVDNFAPGVMEKLGLGPKALQQLKPGLIVIAMSAFGAEGPWSFFRAYGITAEMASSLPFANGREGWPPTLQHMATGDPVAGLFGAAAALAALHGREALGGGVIDMAQVECVFQLGTDAILTRQVTGRPVSRTGNRRSGVAPCCVVATRGHDTWITVAVDSEPAWQALCRVIGKAAWSSNAAFASVQARNDRADEIEDAIAEWAAQRSSFDAVALLQSAGVPAAPVLPSHALANDPQLLQSGFWQHMERRHLGRHLMGAAPFRFDGKRPPLRSAAPLLGEHSDEILAEAD